jgi:uncharacterized damage-inducible protein DinB
MRDLLIETFFAIPPEKALAGLSPEDASRLAPGAPHTIAQLLAHMVFWQTWFLKRCQGVAEPPAASAALGWPQAGKADWERLRAAFLDGLEQLAVVGEDRARLDLPVTPAIEFPPLAHHTIRDALMHVAAHNAHHLGQVILLRQQLGTWPPPAGSFTW